MATATETRKIGTIKITSGDTTSTSFAMGETIPCAFSFPAMTGTSVTLYGSTDNITFVPLADSTDNNYTITVSATAKIRTVNPQNLAGVQYIQLVSGSAEGADRTITVLGKY